MKSWFPEKGEKWLFQVEVEGVRRTGIGYFVRYRPLYLQQQGAVRELEEKVFSGTFSRQGEGTAPPEGGSRWVLPVEIVGTDRKAMTVDYRHSKAGSAGGVRKMSVHVFRATFRREDAGEHDSALFDAEWNRERRAWQAQQTRPARGANYMLSVKIMEVREAGGKRSIKYMPMEQEAGSAPRILEEPAFREIFDPVDGAVPEAAPNQAWFMLVQVTDYDPEEYSVWYKPVDPAGGAKGGVRHLSDHIFLATFRPEK